MECVRERVAGGGGGGGGGTVYLGAVHMVLTSLECVRVHSFCDDAIADPPVPRSRGVSAAATSAAVVAARHEVLNGRGGRG